MSDKIKYCAIVKRENQALYMVEDDCPNKLIVILSCRLEDEYPDAKGQVIKKSSGEIVYQCRRTSIC